MNPVPGRARTAAVALADRTDHRHERSCGDARAAQRIGPDDHSNGTGPIVKKESQPIGEGRRGAARHAAHGHTKAFERLADRPGRRDRRFGKATLVEDLDIGQRDPEGPCAVSLVDGPGQANARPGIQRRGEGGVKVDGNPAGPVLQEADPPGLDGAERRRQDSLNERQLPFRQRAGIDDGDAGRGWG